MNNDETIIYEGRVTSRDMHEGNGIGNNFQSYEDIIDFMRH